MKDKIKISRTIDLKSSNLTPENQEFHDVLLTALKNELNIGKTPQDAKWHDHRIKKTYLFNNLNNYVQQYAAGLYTTGKGLVAKVNARGNAEIPMTFRNIDIIDYDWKETVHFRLIFESPEYLLMNNFGALLLLSPIHDGLSTFIVDMGINLDLSVSNITMTRIN